MNEKAISSCEKRESDEHVNKRRRRRISNKKNFEIKPEFNGKPVGVT